MPLRFRSVVPYTLPGVLALIGWWWYISRKKDRLLDHAELKRPPSSASLRTSPSNGVIENGTNASPTDETARPSSPSHTTEKTVERDISSHAQDNGDATLRVEENQSLKDEVQTKTCSSELDICESKQEIVLSAQLTKVSDSNISEEERPEPEGEVATVCSVSPLQRVAPRMEVETPISLQDFHQNILTSTPSLPVCTAAIQEITCEKVEQQPKEVEPDLELLAAGLITEVISAATQEVLGDSHCPLSESTRICAQEIVTMEQELVTRTSSEVQKSDEGVLNGCSTDTVVDSASQRLNCSSQTKPKVEEVVLEEDLAGSTCHSEVSSEDLHQTDNIQVTDLSAQEEETQAEVLDAAEQRALSEDGSVEGVCDLKKLNGMSLGNGAHGTDAETDQSGGEGSDVNSMDSVDSGCIGESNHSSSSSEVIVWEIEVPKHLVGRLIGKQGRYVSFLKQSSGAKIYISTLPYTQEFQICHIEGTQQQVRQSFSSDRKEV
ncbi:hypothetical protein WMY93_028901 [Mugilogobius chulae]|uniref:K Homology domain-containing protein n=1 Tax=Mugilogobius chulae TaxID=88201 RepID=A0AAW0MPP3_9GOBI